MYDNIIEIVKDQAGLDKDFVVNETTNLNEDLNIDSLDKISIITTIEDEFGIEFDEEALEGMETVGDMMKYIKNNTK